MSLIPDGIYSIELPQNGGAITDEGERRYLSVLPPGSINPTAHQIKVTTNSNGSRFQFVTSKKYVTWNNDPSFNNKLVTGDTASYLKIQPHEYISDAYTIMIAKDTGFSVSLALERIFPPWVAMNTFPETQPWLFTKVATAKL